MELLGASDQRIEQPLTRSFGQVHAVRQERIGRHGGRAGFAARRQVGGRRSPGGGKRRLRNAVRDVVENVQTRDALAGQELCGIALRLLENRREDVARVRFVPLCALDVQNRGLQDAAKCHRLLRFPLRPASLALDRFVEVRAERAPQRRQVGAAGREDSLAVRIVREGVEEVLEREIRVPPRDRFAEGNVQHDLDGRLQRVPGFARARHERVDFGFRHFPRVDAGHTTAVDVHLHHNAVRLGRRFLEHGFQDVDDEVHGRVVVIEQDDAVQRRLLGFAPDAFLDRSTRLVLMVHPVGHISTE